MAREFDVQVKGLDGVDRMLADLPLRVGRSVQVAALKKAAEPIAEAARRLAPKRTGVLAASIRVAVKRGATAARATVQIGLEAPGRWYGHLVEFGTKPHSLSPGDARSRRYVANPDGPWHPGTSPQPFMRPAFEFMKNHAIDVYVQSIRAEIERYLKRQAKRRR